MEPGLKTSCLPCREEIVSEQWWREAYQEIAVHVRADGDGTVCGGGDRE